MSLSRAHISRAALEHNYRFIQEQVKKPICAVIKAFAYGHGDEYVAHVLENLGVHRFAVSSWYEANRLRDAGIRTPILLLGAPSRDYLAALISQKIELTCSSLDELKRIEATARLLRKKAIVHAKIDTTMHRIGAYPEDFVTMIDYLKTVTDVIELKGVSTHCPGKPGEEETDKAWDIFQQTASYIPSEWRVERHWQNSAGLTRESDADCVRPGLALFGYHQEWQDQLKPVLSFCAPLMIQKRIKKGDPVGYDSTWRAPRDTNIGVVSAGYADGIPRLASGKLKVWINGKPYPQIGKICMDMMMIDLGEDSYEDETEVCFFGETADQLYQLAEAADTIVYEILCSISRRVLRVPQDL